MVDPRRRRGSENDDQAKFSHFQLIEIYINKYLTKASPIFVFFMNRYVTWLKHFQVKSVSLYSWYCGRLQIAEYSNNIRQVLRP